MNANELYWAMLCDVNRARKPRRACGADTPQSGATEEAEAGRSYVVRDPLANLVTSRRVDVRWAVANTIHFFAATEKAGCLKKYNSHANKYLTGDLWDGAYGAIAKVGINDCIRLLNDDPATRRAVVSMGDLRNGINVNRPACWSFLHFLVSGDELDLLVYQRSLSLNGVMPYDLVVLTNVLNYAAINTGVRIGKLRWMVGSLHTTAHVPVTQGQERSLVLDVDLLREPDRCLATLNDDKLFQEVMDEL